MRAGVAEVLLNRTVAEARTATPYAMMVYEGAGQTSASSLRGDGSLDRPSRVSRWGGARTGSSMLGARRSGATRTLNDGATYFTKARFTDLGGAENGTASPRSAITFFIAKEGSPQPASPFAESFAIGAAMRLCG